MTKLKEHTTSGKSATDGWSARKDISGGGSWSTVGLQRSRAARNDFGSNWGRVIAVPPATWVSLNRGIWNSVLTIRLMVVVFMAYTWYRGFTSKTNIDRNLWLAHHQHQHNNNKNNNNNNNNKTTTTTTTIWFLAHHYNSVIRIEESHIRVSHLSQVCSDITALMLILFIQKYSDGKQLLSYCIKIWDWNVPVCQHYAFW